MKRYIMWMDLDFMEAGTERYVMFHSVYANRAGLTGTNLMLVWFSICVIGDSLGLAVTLRIALSTCSRGAEVLEKHSRNAEPIKLKEYCLHKKSK